MEDWSLPTTNITVNVSGHDAVTLNGLPPSFYLNATNLTGELNSTVLPLTGTPGTYTKITTDAYGRVISGANLSANDIPPLDASKITTGYFLNRIDVAGYPAMNRGIQFSSLVNNSPVIRWLLYSSFGTEPGANADSNFGIVRYADNGTQLAIPFVINRSTGNISITTTTASTSTTSGALVVSGGIGVQGTLNADILSGLVQLKTYATGAEPTASASTIGQIWLNTTTGKIRYVASATTIQTITST